MQLTVGELSAIMGGVFALTTTIIGVLVKMLFSSYREKSLKEIEAIKSTNDLEIRSIREAMEAAKNAADLEIRAIREARENCAKNHRQHEERLSVSMEKLNDSWFNFIREDAAMEATRGRKVDALFGVVDNMKDSVRQIPENINKKIEEIYRQIKHELENELHDFVSVSIKRMAVGKEV